MTITLELPPEVEARFVAEAQRTGLPVGEIVKAYLIQSVPPPEAIRLTMEEWDGALDKLFDDVNVPEGTQEGAFHRENWYR